MSTQPAYQYAATLVRVIDGDTLIADVDLGFFVHDVVTVRVHGINAPELHATGGADAKNGAAALLTDAFTLVCVGPDKYGGRWQGVVTLANGDDLATRLVNGGFAAWWDGHGPRPVPVATP